MNKLTNELYLKHAKRLSVIINPQSQFARYLARQDFASMIESELNVLAVLENKFKDEKVENELKSENLVKLYNELTKKEFAIDKKFKLEDDGDYIDSINYLYTYCKNIFKVDIDELVEGKKVNVAAPDINLGKESRAESEPSSEGVNPFMAGMAGMAGMEGMDGMMNPFIYAQATTKLNKEVSSGEVYQFNAKPKIIPIIKIILAALLYLLVISSIVTSVFVFLTHNISYTNTEGKSNQWSTISYGMFYIITGAFSLYVAITNTKQIIASKKNDNYKYSFSWAFYVAVLVLIIFISLMDLRVTWFIGVTLDTTTIKYTVGFTGWKYLIIVNCALVALTLIPTIIGAVKTPKVDNNRMAALLKQYMEELTPSQTPASSASAADVQKPVDVKPSKAKKEDKDDDKPLKS